MRFLKDVYIAAIYFSEMHFSSFRHKFEPFLFALVMRVYVCVCVCFKWPTILGM